MIKLIYLFTPVYVSLFWSIVLILTKSKENQPKHFLGYFMLIAFILYFSHANFFLENYALYIWLDAVYLFASLATFPMYYIYVRLLTTDKKPSFKKHSFYILPSIVIGVLTFLGYYFMEDEERLFYVSQILKDANPEKTHIYFKFQNAVLNAKKIVFVVQTVVFSILCYKIVKEHNKEILNYYSNTEGNELKWLHFFNITLIFTSVFSLSAQVMGREVFANNEAMLPIPAFIFSVLLFVIGFLGNKQTSVHLTDETLVIRDHKSTTPALKLKQRLNQALVEDKIFLDPNLKVTELVGLFNTNRTYISKVINDEFQMNFNDLVNLHRISYAKELLKDKKYNKYHLEAIAQMAGFGSLNSFTRAFQKIEHVTPGRYRSLLN